MNDYRTPIHESVIIDGDRPTVEELHKLLIPLMERVWLEGGPVVVSIRNGIDAQSDPRRFISVTEVEPAYEIRPYFRVRQSMYKGL